MNIAVIGGGIAGLSTAILLARAGHAVTVYEKNEVLGGRAGLFSEQGFTFDMGPSWYLMPDVFERFFKDIGEDITNHLSLVRLDPSYRVYFQGMNEPVDIAAAPDKVEEVIERLQPGGGAVFRDYLKKVDKQYTMVIDHFLYKEYRSFKDLISWQGIKALGTLPLIGNMDQYLKKFFTSKKVRQLLEYSMVFLGSSPYQAPALYAMMSHVDFGLGVYYPQGGIHTLIQALVNIATKHGVQFKLNQPVAKIQVIDGTATAIVLEDGTEQPYDIIVSNADMHHTETQLLEKQYQTYPQSYWDKKILAPSAVLLYLGIQGTVDSLQHHTLYFAEQWEEHFDTIFKNPSWPDNPSYYICAPSKTDPNVAPVGYENLFVLVPIASRFGTPDETDQYVEKILDHIADTVHIPDLKQRIVYKKVFRPDEFQSRYNSMGGTALGLAHTLGQTAFLRPQNKSKKVTNLYYAGAGVHPGIGMPVCVISAQLVSQRILQEHKNI